MVLLRPLVDRAKTQGMLEVDSILATFGLLFLFQGLMLRGFGGAYTSYTFLAERFEIFGTFYGLNRVVAFAAAVVIALALYVFLYRTRYGTAVRAVAVNPELRKPRRHRRVARGGASPSRSAARSPPAAARCSRPSTPSTRRWASSSP